MLKDYKYNINQEVIVISNAKDLISLRGEKAIVAHMLPTSYNHDYIIVFENNKELRVKESEIAPIDNKELLNIKTGDLVIYIPTNEVGEVLKVDYFHGHVEIKFKDNGSAVTGIESLRKFEDEGEKQLNEKEKTVVECMVEDFLGHYKNSDGTYTVPKQLLINLINSAYEG